MKQFVVAMAVLAVFFVGGPWFANKIGPGLADLITETAIQEPPCPTATATPSAARHKQRGHPHRKHAKPKAQRPRGSARVSAKPSPSASPTCVPAEPATDS